METTEKKEELKAKLRRVLAEKRQQRKRQLALPLPKNNTLFRFNPAVSSAPHTPPVGGGFHEWTRAAGSQMIKSVTCGGTAWTNTRLVAYRDAVAWNFEARRWFLWVMLCLQRKGIPWMCRNIIADCTSTTYSFLLPTISKDEI